MFDSPQEAKNETITDRYNIFEIFIIYFLLKTKIIKLNCGMIYFFSFKFKFSSLN